MGKKCSRAQARAEWFDSMHSTSVMTERIDKNTRIAAVFAINLQLD
jgi:hypothetical protein